MIHIARFGTLVLLLITLASASIAQGLLISANPAGSPAPSAIMDLQSTQKGFLIPRMSVAQRDLIPSPAVGLMIYCTNASPAGVFVYSGSSWRRVAGSSIHDGDGDTSVDVEQLNGEDRIRFTTSGTERMIIDQSGRMGIGTDTPAFQVHIAGQGSIRLLNIENSADLEGVSYAVYATQGGNATGHKYGMYNNVTNTQNGSHYGIYNNMTGTGSGDHYGAYNNLAGAGTGSQYGVNNYISNSGDNVHVGLRNVLNGSGTGLHYGSSSILSGTGSGAQYGMYNEVNNSGSGNHFGSSNRLSGTGLGNKYAFFGRIAPEAGGTKYAGYFDGNVTVTGIWDNPSDRTLKTNITPLRSGSAVSRLQAIQIYEYTYDRASFPYMSLPATPQTGVLAQELQEIYPDLVKKNIHPGEVFVSEDGTHQTTPDIEFLGVNYIGLIPHLISAIQEQQESIDALQAEISVLKGQHTTAPGVESSSDRE